MYILLNKIQHHCLPQSLLFSHLFHCDDPWDRLCIVDEDSGESCMLCDEDPGLRVLYAL